MRLRGLRVLGKSPDLISRAVAIRGFHLIHFPCLPSALQCVWYVSCGNIY